MDSGNINLAQIYRDYRRSRRMSQRDMADLVGLDQTTISMLELGKFVPARADTIARYLGSLALDGGCFQEKHIQNRQIGFVLKSFRRRHGLSQMELAIILDIPKSTLASYESGKIHPGNLEKTNAILEQLALLEAASQPAVSSGKVSTQLPSGIEQSPISDTYIVRVSEWVTGFFGNLSAAVAFQNGYA